jgi:hypothetical protein
MTTMERVVSQRTVVRFKLRRVPRPSGGLEAIIVGWPVGDELKPERVQEWLAAWPSWQLAGKGNMIQRSRMFPGSEMAAHYGDFVTALARSLALSVTVEITGREVLLSLYSGHRGGRLAPLTATVLDFATHLG